MKVLPVIGKQVRGARPFVKQTNHGVPALIPLAILPMMPIGDDGWRGSALAVFSKLHGFLIAEIVRFT
jgi:hypothetical protein